MQLIEIYRSIQGESSFAGLPCIFVRLAGCNLRCHWCDSEYTFTGGNRMSIEDVENEVRRLSPGGLVEITGGEPMLQEKELLPLMERLLASGYELLLETSGERPLERVPEAVHKIVDVKCPDSGEFGTFRPENLRTLGRQDEVKFVISSRADYEYARQFTREHDLVQRTGGVIFSPAFRKDAAGPHQPSHFLVGPCAMSEWILADGLNVRLGLQIHKFIWAPETKGV